VTARDPEVGDNGAKAFGRRAPHHVFRLEITVNDTGLVRGIECSGHLLDDGKRFVGRDPPAPEPLGQRFAGQKLHGQKRDFLSTFAHTVAKEVEHATNVWVCDLTRELDLAAEPFHRLAVPSYLRPNRFESDLFSKLEILGLVDLSHSALREKANDSKPVGYELTGRERLSACSVLSRGTGAFARGASLGVIRGNLRPGWVAFSQGVLLLRQSRMP